MARARLSDVLAALASALVLASGCSGRPGPAAAAPSPYPTDEASLSRPLPRPFPEVVARVNGEAIRVDQVLPMAKKDLDNQTAEDIEKGKPAALRRALLRYVDRELLVQEALARGISADTRRVDWAYDQLRREHPDDADWARFLLQQGLDPQRFKTELRAQLTVAALVDAELLKTPVTDEEARALYQKNPQAFAVAGTSGPASFESARDAVAAAVREARRPATIDALVARLRAKGRVEILI
jgi:SurA-like N-terminal domain